FYFSRRRRHTRFSRDWSSDVCSSDLQYTVNVLEEGISELSLKVAGETASGRITIHIDGQVLANPIVVPATGGGTQWASIPIEIRSEERRVGKERREEKNMCHMI